MIRWSLALCLGILLLADVAVAQQQYGFRIHFSDKKGTEPLSNPLNFLSQRSLDRRSAQGISLDATDQPVSPLYLDTVLNETSGKLHMTSKWMNYCVVLLSDSSKILSLQNKSYITDIEYIAYYQSGLHKPTMTTGSGNTTAKTTGTAAYYGKTFEQTQLVGGDYLHDLGYKGEGMLIAVLDEGFIGVNTRPGFDSLRTAGRIIDEYNFVNRNTNVYSVSGHGTDVLSTMAVNVPGTYVGSAPNASYALYNTEIALSEQVMEMDNLVAAAERADSIGADVISVSLGYNLFNLPAFSTLTYADIDGKTTVAAKSANMATSKGIVYVASAGNEGSGSSWNYILTPGDADSALTVGAADINKNPWGSSGYGPNSAGQVKPDVCVMGVQCYIHNGNIPSPETATSYATPQMAGWVACLIQGTTGSTPYKIRKAINESAHIYTTPGAQLGYGVPNLRKAFDLLSVASPKMPDPSMWFTVAPNPFHDHINLRVYERSSSGHLDVRLIDMTGKLVYEHSQTTSQGVQNVTLSIPDIASGIYYLKLKSDTEEGSFKITHY